MKGLLMNWKELNKESLELLKDKSLVMIMWRRRCEHGPDIVTFSSYSSPNYGPWHYGDGGDMNDECALEFWTHYCIITEPDEKRTKKNS